MQASIFRLLSRRSDFSIITGQKHYLRLPQFLDFQQWRDLRAESRAFLQPWEPRWSIDDTTERAFRERVNRNEREYSLGSAVPLFIFDGETHRLMGGITIGNIRRGAAQTCMIGYWMGERYAGQGHMKEALGLTINHIFQRLQLHRVEAACIPDNIRSLKLLENAGFQHEGMLRQYLKIDGAWRDHLLLSRLAEDRDRD